MKALESVKKVVAKTATFALQKSVGNGAYVLSGSNYPMNWFQYGLDPPTRPEPELFGPVVAGKYMIAQDISRIPIRHIKKHDDGSFEYIETKAPHRLFGINGPNHYQTTSDFLLYLVYSLLDDGNFNALAQRNDRGEVNAMYPLSPGSAWPYVGQSSDTYTSGDIYYQVTNTAFSDMAGMPVDDGVTYIPAREMYHQRLVTPQHPLVGETPLVAALAPQMTGAMINEHTMNFFKNMGRPNGVLRMPGALSEDAMKRVKEEWKRITSGANFGEVAVLCNDMQWSPITMNAVDAELVKIFQLEERQIFQLLRIPPYLYGDTEKSVFREVESVLRFYYQTCLSYYIAAIEQGLSKFFRLPPDEKIKFDFDVALLQTDFKQRMESYAKGLQSGVFAPNEVRSREGLGPVEYGDEPRVQQQLVPLSFGAEMQPSEDPTGAPVADDDTDDEELTEEEERALRAHSENILLKAIA